MKQFSSDNSASKAQKHCKHCHYSRGWAHIQPIKNCMCNIWQESPDNGPVSFLSITQSVPTSASQIFNKQFIKQSK